MSIEELLKRTYAASNARDIKAVLGVMHVDVDLGSFGELGNWSIPILTK
jgi:hypothetical protein